MFTICENKPPTQNSWNQMLPDSHGTSTVNIDDASFGGFSKQHFVTLFKSNLHVLLACFTHRLETLKIIPNVN